MFPFNVRVYGLLLTDNREVLVSDELIRGKFYTKFPGGGLEFGEGTRDCLKREFKEEMDLSVEVGEHLYTTDYFQPSAFHPDHQVLSIYYYVRALEPLPELTSTTPFTALEELQRRYPHRAELETFRLIPLEVFSAESVTLPIDKIAAELVKKRFG